MIQETIDKIKETLIAEPFINTTSDGDIFKIDVNKQDIYPLGHVIVNSMTSQGNVLNYNLSVILMDIAEQKQADNSSDIWRIQEKVGMRLVSLLQRGSVFEEGYQLEGQPAFEYFIERFENDMAGVAITMNVLVPNDMTIC